MEGGGMEVGGGRDEGGMGVRGGEQSDNKTSKQNKKEEEKGEEEKQARTKEWPIERTSDRLRKFSSLSPPVGTCFRTTQPWIGMQK